MATSIQAKIAPLPRGDYSSSATYAKLDVVSYNGSSYMAIKTVPTGTVPTNTTYWQLLAEKPTIGEGSITTDMLADGAVTADKLDSSVSEVYAEVSGTYEDMVVGSAEQLLSTQYDTDSVPYAFRKSPYGDREFDEIHGGTIAWNQLHPISTRATATSSDVTFTNNNDGSITANGTATATALWASVSFVSLLINGHKYLLVGCPSGGGGDKYQLSMRANNGSTVLANDMGSGVMYSATSGLTNIVFYLRIVSGVTVNNIVYRPQLFDLTQMFGTTVADYIYGLETNHTGDGVAFFRSLFPKPYYAYNAGELISVSGLSAHKMTGFNQFDVDNANLSQGDFNNETSGSATNVVTRNYTRAVGGTTYAWSQTAFNDGGARYVRFYDADKNFITGINPYGNGIKTFTSPTNACYAKFMWYKQSNVSVADVRNGQVCISFDSEKNGQYEPYESYSYALDDSLTLRGVPKLVDNKVQFDGDIYSSDGTVQRRYGIVDLGTLTFSASTNFFYRANSQDLGIIADVQAPIIAVDTNIDYVYYYSSSHQLRVYVKDVTKPLTGSLVYLLATPITESAEPYVNPQICNEYGTEEYISAEQNGVTMIVGHNTKYPQNLRKKIEGLPWNFSNLIAPTEVTNKASRNYTVGSFLIMNNTLYKVTSAIANGGTITVGSNVSATTIMQEILAL